MRVRDLMTRPVFTVQPTDPVDGAAALLADRDITDVARTMLDRDVRSMPGVDNGNVIGIVSRRDLLRSVTRTDHSVTVTVARVAP